MFKFVAVLAFVAACSATYNVGPSKTFMVDFGKDYIKVANDFGKYVIFKVDKYYGYEGPQTMFIEYYGQHTTPKVVTFLDRKVETEGLYQSEVLYKLFTEYNGQIDAVQYEKILDIIREYVKNDQVYPTVLYALKALYGDDEALNYFYQEAHQTPYSKQGYYGKGYRYGDYETPYDKFSLYFGKNYGYGDYNRNYYNKDYYRQGYSSYYPHQYAHGTYEKNYEPYGYEHQYTRQQGLYQHTPYKNWGFLFGKAGYGYDSTYNYPSKYGYSQEYYGPYNREYQQIKGQYGYGYPQKYFGQYPRYTHQFGKTYDVAYPQQYQGAYSHQYYGPYANQHSNYMSGYGMNYGSNLHYQKPYYF